MKPFTVAELVPLAPGVKSRVMLFSSGARRIAEMVFESLTVDRARPAMFSLATTVPAVGAELVPFTVTTGLEAPATATVAEREMSHVYHLPAGTVTSVPLVVRVLEKISSGPG